jgi:hypothetical protein
MQEQDYKQLQNDFFHKVSSIIPEVPREELRKSVEESFKQMTDEQKIMSLSEDEVRLLLDFRKWSASSRSASGVFHWRKQFGKKEK